MKCPYCMGNKILKTVIEDINTRKYLTKPVYECQSCDGKFRLFPYVVNEYEDVDKDYAYFVEEIIGE